MSGRRSILAVRAVGRIAAGLLLAVAPGRADDRAGLVLLANRAVPESLALAREYCALREISEDRICALDLPEGEVMSRWVYEKRLRDPLLAWLRENGWIDQVKRSPRRVRPHESEWNTVRSRVRVLCSFHGVPALIEGTEPRVIQRAQVWLNHAPQRDEAAVDSELTLLLFPPYDIRGRVGNPLYNQLRWEPGGLFLLLATRLDGPDPGVVRRMMRDTLDAERHGLHGRAYFDLRGPHADDYQAGDYWLAESIARLQREGYDCIADNTDQVFARQFPMNDAAFYFGWYAERVAGPFLRTGFAFRAGALAYHNHSANAKSLRSADAYWCGPLLARRAAATWGAVREPFLATTPQVNILLDRLCRGLTLAESTYLAMPSFSWQITVVGDPLYRPFAVPLDQQIRILEDEDRPEVEWAWLRRVNQLVREGRLNAGLAYARDRLKVREGALLNEKIAELLALNELPEDAARHYEKAIELAPDAESGIRAAGRYLLMLRAAGQGARAAELEADLRARWGGSPFLTLLQYARPEAAGPP